MKNVKIQCRSCGRELWKGMPESRQKATTIYEANMALCSDCQLEESKEKWEDISIDDVEHCRKRLSMLRSPS